MRQAILFYFVLITATVLWTGCIAEDAADVNQDRIKTDYSLTYDGETDETTASASFVFGSTFLKLNDPSQVTVNDESMMEEELFGIVAYGRVFNGVMDLGVFEYQNNESEVFENTIALPNSIDLPEMTQGISIAQTEMIFWEGKPVGQDEVVTLTFTRDGLVHFVTIDARNATFFELQPNELSNAFVGQASMVVGRRIVINPDEAPDAGGSLSSVWKSEKYSVDISQ